MGYSIEAILAMNNNLMAKPKEVKKETRKEKTDIFQVMLDQELEKLRAQK